MLSSTREIAPSCIENVDELIERQEKSLQQLDAKRTVVTDLIDKGKVILQHPEKPKFLEANVKRIEEGWEDIKKVKKMFNLDAANADLKKRQDILKKSTDTINGLFSSINSNMATMSITIPEDKKKILTKEIKAVEGKLE